MPEFGFAKIKSGKIIPLKDGYYNIGEDNLRWKSIYANEFIGNIDWNNIINKPSPIISLSGDVSGSGAISLDSGGTISVTVADDSHSHSDETITSVDWSKILNKPAAYPPEAHTHSRSDITDFWSEPFWENIPDKPAMGIALAVDDTEYSVTGTTETEAKYFRFYKSSGIPTKTLRLVLSAYSSDGSGTIKVYIDGTEEASISVTATSETTYEQDIDISGLVDGLHTVSIRLVGGSDTETVTTSYLLAVGVM